MAFLRIVVLAVAVAMSSACAGPDVRGPFRGQVVDADTGNIGGTKSHEFHVLSNAGEDILLLCNSCDYSSNVEKALTYKHYMIPSL